MRDLPTWAKKWTIAAASLGGTPAALSGSIGFRTENGELCIDLTRGEIGEVERCSSWIECADRVLGEIALGTLNAQKAFVTGELLPKGEPEVLLQFATLVESGLRGG